MSYYAICDWLKKKENDKPTEVITGSRPKPDDSKNYCGLKKGFLLSKPKKNNTSKAGKATSENMSTGSNTKKQEKSL